MIQYPGLKAAAPYRQRLEVFKGLNRSFRIGKGEFCELENLTSDDFPVLSTRRKRGKINYAVPDECREMFYIPDAGLFYVVNHREENGQWAELRLRKSSGEIASTYVELNQEPKQFALMGRKLIIAPDMIAVDIHTLSHEKMEYALAIRSGLIYFQMCREDGTFYGTYEASSVAPADPTDGAYWLDLGAEEECFKQYSATEETWIDVQSTCIRIWGSGLSNHLFRKDDTVTLSGIGMKDGATNNAVLAVLNGSHHICAVDQDSIVVSGVLMGSAAMLCDAASVIRIERSVPVLDFVVESGNRLWGCAKNTNQIYACKLGDYHNWNCFQGLSTDSWVGNIGTPGEFTGAVAQNGYPVFYKENCKHKVWPSSTSAHQITTVLCDGVEKGSENSIAVLDGTVFYKSKFGVFADDGGGAVEIGQCLGDIPYHHAAAAIHDRKYYLSMQDGKGESYLFVYDIVKGMWHRESGMAEKLCAGGKSVYCAVGNELWDLTGNTGEPEEAVSWMAVTGDLGLELPEQKYISRLTLRLCLEPGATLEIYAQYDREQVWVKLGQVYGKDLHSFSLPVRPRRCDQLRLKLQGKGMCKLYSITETLAKGSELP